MILESEQLFQFSILNYHVLTLQERTCSSQLRKVAWSLSSLERLSYHLSHSMTMQCLIICSLLRIPLHPMSMHTCCSTSYEDTSIIPGCLMELTSDELLTPLYNDGERITTLHLHCGLCQAQTLNLAVVNLCKHYTMHYRVWAHPTKACTVSHHVPTMQFLARRAVGTT
jgi:hypothetical protein